MQSSLLQDKHFRTVKGDSSRSSVTDPRLYHLTSNIKLSTENRCTHTHSLQVKHIEHAKNVGDRVANAFENSFSFRLTQWTHSPIQAAKLFYSMPVNLQLSVFCTETKGRAVQNKRRLLFYAFVNWWLKRVWERGKVGGTISKHWPESNLQLLPRTFCAWCACSTQWAVGCPEPLYSWHGFTFACRQCNSALYSHWLVLGSLTSRTLTRLCYCDSAGLDKTLASFRKRGSGLSALVLGNRVQWRCLRGKSSAHW